MTAHAALAPRVRSDTDERLDVFEEALLGLIGAGVIDPVELARLVHIDERLARYIVRGLEDRHLIHDAKLTDRGERALRHDASSFAEAVLGYVFRDATTGEMWPRFLDGALPVVDCDWSKSSPIVELGTVARPRSRSAVFVPAGGRSTSAVPSPAEVRRAVADHRRALGANPIEEGWSGDVRPVDVEGEPVFLLLVLEPADELATGQKWSVRDPFGAPNPLLNRWVSAAAETGLHLERALTSVAERGSTRFARLDADPLSEELESLPALRTAILDVREALAEVHSIGDMGERAPERKRGDAALAIGRAFERMLRFMLTAHPAQLDRGAAVAGEPEHVRELLADVLTMVGFDPVPPSLLGVRTTRIRAALERGAGTARPLLLACAVGAIDRTVHPLRSLAAERPDLLVEVARLIDARDASAHDWSDVPAPRGAIPTVGDLDRFERVLADLVRALAKTTTQVKTP